MEMKTKEEHKLSREELRTLIEGIAKHMVDTCIEHGIPPSDPESLMSNLRASLERDLKPHQQATHKTKEGIGEEPNHNTQTEKRHKETFKRILKRTIENNRDLLKELAKR